jgi:tetratricopeptide (TPR) repeat protein
LEEYAAFLAKHERQEAALAVVKEVLGMDGHLSAAHLTRARLLGKSGDRAEALAEGEKALAGAMDADEERAAHSFLAKTYFAAGEPEKARTHTEWVELHP